MEYGIELPEIKQVVREKLRSVQNNDFSTLTEDQRFAAETLIQYLTGQTAYDMLLLSGYAGVGKTHTISSVIEHYLFHHRYSGKIALTAPVNKAVKVISKMAQYSDNRLGYKTVHSLLGLKPKVAKNGEIEFVKDWDSPASIEETGIVILDEVSQLNDELFYMLKDYVDRNGLKLIFIGDPAQIPPIKSKNHKSGSDSIPLNPKYQEEYKIGVVHLTEVIRQAADNPIIAVATQLRNNLMNRGILNGGNTVMVDANRGLLCMDLYQDKESIRNLMSKWFTSENFAVNADFVKVVAWTNKTVDHFNNTIRKMIFGKDCPPLCVGEKLIANTPIFDIDEGAMIVFTTNDDFTVDSFKIETRQYKGKELKYYLVRVLYDDYGVDNYKTIRVLHEDSQEDYLDILATMMELAKIKTKEGVGGSYWQEFYKFQQNFADIKYNYAITAHKAQGSTYTNVIVIESDIDQNQNIKERNRLKYTACTRPTDLLVVVN